MILRLYKYCFLWILNVFVATLVLIKLLVTLKFIIALRKCPLIRIKSKSYCSFFIIYSCLLYRFLGFLWRSGNSLAALKPLSFLTVLRLILRLNLRRNALYP